MLAYTCHQLAIFHENNKFASIMKKWIQQNNSLSCMHTLQPFELFKFRSHSAKRTDAYLPHCQPTGIRNLAHTKMRSPNHYLELGVSLTSSVFANVLWVFLCEWFYCYCCVFVCLFLRKDKFPIIDLLKKIII